MRPEVDKAALRAEVDANYDHLQRRLSSYLPAQQGRYALLRSCDIIGFFDRPGEAYREAIRNYPDGLFSIQEVTDEPIDLGFFSYAGA